MISLSEPQYDQLRILIANMAYTHAQIHKQIHIGRPLSLTVSAHTILFEIRIPNAFLFEAKDLYLRAYHCWSQTGHGLGHV